MPEVSDYDNEKDWMAACVPVRIEEGGAQDQAVAVCLSIWRERNKGKAMNYEAEITLLRNAWHAVHPTPKPQAVEEAESWVREVSSDSVIVEVGVKKYRVSYTKDEDDNVTFASYDEWQEVEQAFVPAKHNALKTISKTAETLRVGNYIVLFGGRDLEGVLSDRVNTDGSTGEYFTAETQLESNYTKTGVLYVDWEHGADATPDAPKAGDILGVVDWSTAKADNRGMWVERALNRRSEYVQALEALIDAGLVGNSSEAIPDGVQKAEDGRITRWPLRRDTLTVTPMEPRMLTENVVSALKALNIHVPQPEPEAGPEAPAGAATAAKARLILLEIDLQEIEQ